MAMLADLFRAVDRADADTAHAALRDLLRTQRAVFSFHCDALTALVAHIPLHRASAPRELVAIAMLVGTWCGQRLLASLPPCGDETLRTAMVCGSYARTSAHGGHAQVEGVGPLMGRKDNLRIDAAFARAERMSPIKGFVDVQILFASLLATLQQDLVRLSWARVRAAVRVRPYALHWLEVVAMSQCAPEGAARKRDRLAFEADVTCLMRTG